MHKSVIQTLSGWKGNKEKAEHNSLSINGNQASQLCAFQGTTQGGNSEMALGSTAPRLNPSFRVIQYQETTLVLAVVLCVMKWCHFPPDPLMFHFSLMTLSI